MKIKSFKNSARDTPLLKTLMLVQFRDLLLQRAHTSSLRTRDFLSLAAGRFGVGCITFNHSLERRNRALHL